MGSTKRLFDENSDRISELPINVIDHILEKLPILDAARTTIMSRKWRHIWASYPKLVFDMNFFNHIYAKHKECIQYEYPKAINKILFVHSGPIQEFCLYIPNIPKDLTLEIDEWMSYLSRNGIKELELQNRNSTSYILPSCLFSCSSLTDLKLRNCIMKSPPAFGGFRDLVTLKLQNVSLSSGVSASIFQNFPVLEALTLFKCMGIKHETIRAPILDYFCMVSSGIVDWQWFDSCKGLITLQVELRMEVKNVEQNINMMKFIKVIPEVEALWLDGFSLKYLAVGNPPESLTPTSAVFLTSIKLVDFRFYDLDQISSAVLLLKSCPGLIILELDVATSTCTISEPLKGYFDLSEHINMNLERLQTVKIRYFTGSTAELHFIKFLLGCSTCLRRMIIEQSRDIGAIDEVNVFRELLCFTRASSRAEIIHTVPSK